MNSWNASYTGTTTSGGLKNGALLYGFSHNGYLYDLSGNTITSGGTYNSPLLELNGNVGSISNFTTPMKTTGFKPSIQVKDLINRIFNQNGFTIESNFLIQNIFNDYIFR